MKIYSVDTWICDALNRIERFCGDRPYDWMCEIAEEAMLDWTDEDGNIDWESVEIVIDSNADSYMYFIQSCYPERVREEM